MILQVLQMTLLDIATHRIGNPISLLTADLNEDDNSMATTTNVLQPKIDRKDLKNRVLREMLFGLRFFYFQTSSNSTSTRTTHRSSDDQNRDRC